MDAPTYPPAKTYVPPRRIPRFLSTRDTPIATLQSIPEAWAIVEEEIPGMDRRIGNDQMQPHLGNFSFESLLVFSVVQPEFLERLNAKLHELGEYP